MKKIFYTFLCLLFFNTLSAQTYEVTNLRVSAFSHNFECGDDAFFTDPEPNFRVNWRVTGGIFGSLAVVNPGSSTLACGSYTTNVPLSPDSYTGTVNTLQFYAESWEEDECGDANTFDDDCSVNDDDNYANTSQIISLTGSSIVLTMDNGSSVTIDLSLIHI